MRDFCIIRFKEVVRVNNCILDTLIGDRNQCAGFNSCLAMLIRERNVCGVSILFGIRGIEVQVRKCYYLLFANVETEEEKHFWCGIISINSIKSITKTTLFS